MAQDEGDPSDAGVKFPLSDVKGQVWHSRDVAAVLGLSQTRLIQLGHEGVLRPIKRAHYVVGEAILAYVSLLRGKNASREAKPDSVGAAKTRLLMARATEAEISVELKQGRVALVADFELVWSRAIERMRQRLLALPSKVAPLVAVEDDANACADIIEQLVYEALEELSGVDVRTSKDQPAGDSGAASSDGEGEATDEDDGVGVGGLEEATEP